VYSLALINVNETLDSKVMFEMLQNNTYQETMGMSINLVEYNLDTVNK